MRWLCCNSAAKMLYRMDGLVSVRFDIAFVHNRLSPSNNFGDIKNNYTLTRSCRPIATRRRSRWSTSVASIGTASRARNNARRQSQRLTSVPSAHSDTIRFMQIKFIRITHTAQTQWGIDNTNIIILCIYNSTHNAPHSVRINEANNGLEHQQYHNIPLCCECIGTRCDHCVTAHARAKRNLRLNAAYSNISPPVSARVYAWLVSLINDCTPRSAAAMMCEMHFIYWTPSQALRGNDMYCLSATARELNMQANGSAHLLFISVSRHPSHEEYACVSTRFDHTHKWELVWMNIYNIFDPNERRLCGLIIIQIRLTFVNNTLVYLFKPNTMLHI